VYLTVKEIGVKFLLPLGDSLHTYIHTHTHTHTHIFIHRSIVCTNRIECRIHHEKS